MDWNYPPSITVSDTLDLIRQAYENCAKMAEDWGDEKMAHAMRKLIIQVKAEPGEKGKITLIVPCYKEG